MKIGTENSFRVTSSIPPLRGEDFQGSRPMHSATGALPPAARILRVVVSKSSSSGGGSVRCCSSRSICSFNSPSQQPATPSREISITISSSSRRRGLVSLLPSRSSSHSHSLQNAAEGLIVVSTSAYPPGCASSSSHGPRRRRRTSRCAASSAFPGSSGAVPGRELIIHPRSRAAVPAHSRICGGQKGQEKERSSICCCQSSKAPDFRWGRGMELFKPQLVVTSHPFRFQSEYQMTTRATMKDSRNPVCFFGLGAPKPPPFKEIVQAGDPVLHEPAHEVGLEEIGSARIEKIINDMVATMRNAPGVGLAAPQIGIQLQIIVLEDTKEYMSYASAEECEAQQRYPFDLLVIINPKLKTKSGSGRAVFFEGCLSVDGYRALVERDLEVEVTGLGRDGLPITVQANGWKARILQHECDHLMGDLYVDKMVSRTFRTKDNLRLPLPSNCPKPGVVTGQR